MKKVTAAVIALTLIFTLCLPAFAFSSSADAFDSAVISKIESQLRFIEPEKEYYGISSDVDFDQLFLGEKIPAYDVADGTVSEAAITIRPILYNGEWVATASIFNEDGNVDVQISTYYVDQYAAGNYEDIAIVFKNDDVFFYASGSLHGITDSHFAIPCNFEIETSDMENIYRLNTTASVAQNTRLLTTGSYNLYPLCIHQQYDNDCWAACIASLVSYKTGTTVSINSVYNTAIAMNIGITSPGDGASYNQVRQVLQHYYSYPNYTVTYRANNYYHENIVNSIGVNFFPVFAGCPISGNAGHMVLIRGYSYELNTETTKVTGTISYMDPASALFISSSYSAYLGYTTTFKYHANNSSSTFTMNGYITVAPTSGLQPM